MLEQQTPSNIPEFLSYYESFDEANRLKRGAGLLEIARMRELIQRFLPPPPTVVLDVGGGPGAYSCWLAQLGHEVHLIDPVEKHVKQAQEACDSQPAHPLASIALGDARSLMRKDDSADVVLLMGPLYHLTSREQRLAALREAHRVLKPGGLIFAKAINRFAPLLDGLENGTIDDPAFLRILLSDLETGQHRGHPESGQYFTTAFLHLPEELESEVRDAGFRSLGLYAVQGPGAMTIDLENRLSDPNKRKLLLDLVRSVEQEETLLGLSAHFVVVATS